MTARRQAGFTLIELMLTVAITGTLSLAIMAVLTDTTRFNQQMREEASANQEVQNFVYSLEQYLGQLTQLISCNCSTNARTCENIPMDDSCFDFANPMCGMDPGQAIMRFVYEDAGDPITPPGPSCIVPAAATFAGSTIVPRGCKRIMELKYQAPVLENAPATKSFPGVLELHSILPDGTSQRIAMLDNVTFFACGMTVNPDIGTAPGRMSNSNIQIDFEVKSKKLLGEDIARLAEYESWHPNGVNFNAGTRRSHHLDITFRNLTMPGIHFGKLRQYRDCIQSGLPAPSAANCCSGLLAGGTCIAPGDCIANDGSDPAPTATESTECCSRMTNGADQCI